MKRSRSALRRLSGRHPFEQHLAHGEVEEWAERDENFFRGLRLADRRTLSGKRREKVGRPRLEGTLASGQHALCTCPFTQERRITQPG